MMNMPRQVRHSFEGDFQVSGPFDMGPGVRHTLIVLLDAERREIAHVTISSTRGEGKKHWNHLPMYSRGPLQEPVPGWVTAVEKAKQLLKEYPK